jgi:hypothetical protein
VDGHVRAYSGTRRLPKAHIARARISAPATLETWACDANGDPVFVVVAAPGASMVSEVRRLLPELRSLVGQRRLTICFDRGGWSPELFYEIIQAGFDFLTYRKGKLRQEPAAAFSKQSLVEDGRTHEYELADRRTRLRLPARKGWPKTLTMRQVTRLVEDHQTPILTSRADLSAIEVAHRMFSRWRQENYFRYARRHFALAPTPARPTTRSARCPTLNVPVGAGGCSEPNSIWTSWRPAWEPRPWTTRSQRARPCAASRSPMPT